MNKRDVFLVIVIAAVVGVVSSLVTSNVMMGPRGVPTTGISNEVVATSCDGDDVCEAKGISMGNVDYSLEEGEGIRALSLEDYLPYGSGGGLLTIRDSEGSAIFFEVGGREIKFEGKNPAGRVSIRSSNENNPPNLEILNGRLDVLNNGSRVSIKYGQICFDYDDCISSWDELR